MKQLLEEIKSGIACDSVGHPESIVGRTVCIAAHPGKMAIFPFVRWFEKRYVGKYVFARLAFVFDLFLLSILLCLAIVALGAWLWKPVDLSTKILFEADVAPKEVVSGAPSTLTIRYTNGTGKPLENAVLTLSFPDHFLLQGIENDLEVLPDRVIPLGTLAPGDMGSLKIRGVMFGDVGGEQTFRTLLSYNLVDGETKTFGQRLVLHTFSPSRSTLALDLTLPEKLVAGQPINGTIRYKNTGEIDFPSLSIVPSWPEGFRLLTSSVPLANGSFRVPGITTGKEGEITFSGRLGELNEEVFWLFEPSFAFGETIYRQESLRTTSSIVPLPLRVELSASGDALRPGTTTPFTVRYTHVGEEVLENVEIGIEVESPFAASRVYTLDKTGAPELERIEPGASGEITVSLPLRSSIAQSETSVYENLSVGIRAIGQYLLEGTPVVSRSAEVTYPLTSPLVIDAFGRYATTGGDQLGRGPLPPLTLETTKYWVFWNVRGTTNPLTNIELRARLGKNVVFTGRQSLTDGGTLSYDASRGEVVWSLPSLPPTLAPGSRVIGVGFEVGLTPDASQVGLTPTLLERVVGTAADGRTGAFLSTTGASVTTNLPSDPMAKGLGIVEE